MDFFNQNTTGAPDAKISPQGRGKILMNKMIPFTPVLIDKICDESPDVYQAFLNLYKYAVPTFDQVKQIKGFPLISDKTAEYCLSKLHEKTTDPWEANSLWLNKGFSSECGIPDWKISVKNLKLIF